MRRRTRDRPRLLLDVAGLGTVDPFRLALVERPEGSGEYHLEDPGRAGSSAPLDLAGLSLAGASQALLALSMRWLDKASRGEETGPGLPGFGEVRLRLRRRDARLLAALLRRHLDRLPQPPGWMRELLASMAEIDEFLRWERP